MCCSSVVKLWPQNGLAINLMHLVLTLLVLHTQYQCQVLPLGTSAEYFQVLQPGISAEYFVEYFRQVLPPGTCARYFRWVHPLSTSSKYFRRVIPLGTSIGYFHWYFCRVLLVFVLIVQLVARKHQTASFQISGWGTWFVWGPWIRSYSNFLTWLLTY